MVPAHRRGLLEKLQQAGETHVTHKWRSFFFLPVVRFLVFVVVEKAQIELLWNMLDLLVLPYLAMLYLDIS